MAFSQQRLGGTDDGDGAYTNRSFSNLQSTTAVTMIPPSGNNSGTVGVGAGANSNDVGAATMGARKPRKKWDELATATMAAPGGGVFFFSF